MMMMIFFSFLVAARSCCWFLFCWSFLCFAQFSTVFNVVWYAYIWFSVVVCSYSFHSGLATIQITWNMFERSSHYKLSAFELSTVFTYFIVSENMYIIRFIYYLTWFQLRRNFRMPIFSVLGLHTNEEHQRRLASCTFAWTSTECNLWTVYGNQIVSKIVSSGVFTEQILML